MNSDFGERIRQLRKQRGITQQTLANILGITKTMISAYENGVRKPSYENLMELALFFDISMDWMFGNTEDRSGVPFLDITQLNHNQRLLVMEIIGEFKRQNKVERELLANGRPS
jgi:transcriptional regulator with XRE-family HTH domain